jgi:hypothetical protein
MAKPQTRHDSFSRADVQATLERRRLRLENHAEVFVVWTRGCREPFAAVADEALARDLARSAARPGRQVCVFRAALAALFTTAEPEVVCTEFPAGDAGKPRPAARRSRA